MSINTLGPCSICLENIETGQNVWRSPLLFVRCRHIFHTACMENWLEKNSTCPLCRIEVPVFRIPPKSEPERDLFSIFACIRHIPVAREILE